MRTMRATSAAQTQGCGAVSPAGSGVRTAPAADRRRFRQRPAPRPDRCTRMNRGTILRPMRLRSSGVTLIYRRSAALKRRSLPPEIRVQPIDTPHPAQYQLERVLAQGRKRLKYPLHGRQGEHHLERRLRHACGQRVERRDRPRLQQVQPWLHPTPIRCPVESRTAPRPLPPMPPVRESPHPGLPAGCRSPACSVTVPPPSRPTITVSLAPSVLCTMVCVCSSTT